MDNLKKPRKHAKKPPKEFKSNNEFFEHVFNDKEMIWMGQNTNHLHETNLIQDAMISCIESKEYCKYPPPEGFSELQKLILKDLDLEDLDILITAGGTESLYLCMYNLLEKKNNAITCDPGYLIIDDFADRFAGEVRAVPIYNEECHYKLTPKLVRENIDENTKVVVLIDPLNPLGSAYTEEEIKEFAEIAIENDIYMIHDITYKDFARSHYSVAKYAPSHAITIYSFSKISGMAGLRIGAIISSSELIASIRPILINDLGTNLVAQAGAITALRSKETWIERIVTTTRNNQKRIKKMIDTIDDIFIVNYPSDGNMLGIDISKTGINPEKLSENLLDKKIFTRQGSYTSNEFGDKYLRVSFSIPEEQVKIFCKEFPIAIEELRE
ncbi:pyridoxal phosphate-dependent aminotransferase [Methanobrevibacter filiformis]|uniref:Aminotransferase n=1 Tax=Methanobrevibacter filiformis TaxID=55758 RepID=A0A162FAL3_9EURY|nr:pyridoxal phosphate-dependent aminotransferase [Methanobrevibacter filiformis]KZX10295.1 aspartate aminotransferase [Methanobrevibacter filiformis]